tara:strand:+ start:511 stop:975 length:465 start_codon:yes stop_codon:yes gene_type:complete
MELDFSIRHSAEAPREESSTDEVASSKRSLSPVPSSEEHILPSTPDDVKRLRVEINSAFDEAVCSDEMRVSVFGDELDRPPTPNDILDLRALIDAEFDGDSLAPVPVAMDMSPPPREDPFKHAGLFREYGGIKGWLEMQRKDKERGMCGEPCPS